MENRKIMALVFGSVNVDYIYDCDAPHGCFAGDEDPSGSEGAVQEPPAFDGAIMARVAHAPCAGGKGLNQALALWRAGVPVHMLGAVGSDWQGALFYGRAALGQDTHVEGPRHEPCVLRGETLCRSIDNECLPLTLVRIASARTGHVVIARAARGASENAALLHPGANVCHSLETVCPFLNDLANSTSETRVFVVQGETNLQSESLAHARKLSPTCVTVYNPSPRPTRDWAPVRSARISWLVVNAPECSAILSRISSHVPGDHCGQLRALQSLSGAQHVLVTRGEHGSTALVHDTLFVSAPAFRASEVVDTTGAGDTFVGYFLAALYTPVWDSEIARCPIGAGAVAPCDRHAASEGEFAERVANALRIAGAAAAISVGHLGAAPPEACNVRSFLSVQ